jgi:hypothetical protein
MIEVGWYDQTGTLAQNPPWHVHRMIAEAGIDAGWGVARGSEVVNSDPDEYAGYGVRWVTVQGGLPGVDDTAPANLVTPQEIARWGAVGIRVLRSHAGTHHVRDRLTADGWGGALVSDPAYLGPVTGYRLTSDPFGAQLAPVGMGGEFGDWDNNFAAPDWLVPQQGVAQVLGWACPVANPAAHTISMVVQWQSVTGGTDGPVIGVCALTDWVDFFDDGVTSYSAVFSGYQVQLRENGTIAWFKVNADGSRTAGPTGAGTALSAATPYTFTITVSAGNVSITRTGGITVNWADASYRGGYVYLGAGDGGQVQVKDITIA